MKSKQKNRPPGKLPEIADRLHSAAIHLLRQVRKRDTVMAQTPARLSALSVLVFAGPMSLGQLADAEQVKPPTMTRIVTGLEQSGLAERIPDPLDSRRLIIRATPKGTRLIRKGRQARIRYLAELLGQLDDQQCATLEQAVTILEGFLGRPH